ncbi:MAG: hypothetical protein GWP08_17885, partial [Nitrospiraceae bacterium]|nr:hypothetical protein [Nitrospiraceae bacterium]
DPETGARFEENGGTELTALTDAAGTATARLRLGSRPGDVTVLASAQTAQGLKSVRFRAVAGVTKIQSESEGPTGGAIDEVGLALVDPSGAPAEGVTVYFHVEGNSHKSAIKPRRGVTDGDGRATAAWKLGSETQQYYVVAEIVDERPGVPLEQRFRGRGIAFKAMAVDSRKMIITLFGGLAVFVFGMKLMSNGLQRMADRRLKAILNAMTRHRVLAVGVGAMLTAAIQSSSATTVMVVGFVNAGLLNLGQAVGVVFGANIGTTITAQIIAFKLNALAYPAIAIGLILASVARKQSIKAFGETILGFGLLFLGMMTMSAVLKPLRYSPEFQAWFQAFQCTPIDGMVPWKPALVCILIGTITTVVVQSSSATIGLVLALSAQGLLDFYTAVPIVLGDNIGTTITAQLAALGSNRNAKRAALAHTMFNVIGAGYMYLLLFLPWWGGKPLFLGFINSITPGDAFSSVPENLPRHIANAHTAFNIINCLLFIPLIGVMVRLCERLIPLKSTDQESAMEYLDEHLLGTPSLALEQAIREVAYMVRRSQKSAHEACAYFHGGGRELEENVLRREEIVDRLQTEISDYLVELSRRELLPEEAALIPILVHAVNDAERIGDLAEELIKLANQVKEQEVGFSPAAETDLRQLEELLEEQFEATYRALAEREYGDRKRLKRRQIREVAAAISESHVERLGSGGCDVRAGVVFLDYVAYLERIGDHLVAIAKRARKIVRITEN